MKLSNTLVCFALIVIVKGNFFAAAVRGGIEPVILSVGTAFAALGIHSKTKEENTVDPYTW